MSERQRILRALFNAYCFGESAAFEALVDYAIEHDLRGELQDRLWDRFDSYVDLYEYDLIPSDVFESDRADTNRVLTALGFVTW
jgi:hypothetical protein